MASIAVSVDHDYLNVSRPTNVPDPVADQDGANKRYVDGLLEAFQWKDDIFAATTANINLASGVATYDGVTMTLSSRLLVKDQASQPENGIYIWNGVGNPLTRSLDANSIADLKGAIAVVEDQAGASQGGTRWRQTTISGTLGVTNIVWVSDASSAPPASETVAGIVERATQAEVDAGADTTRYASVATLKAAIWRARTYSENIGNGVLTQFDITHNHNDLNPTVTIRYNATGAEIVMLTTVLNANTVRINTNLVPTASQFVVTVRGQQQN